MLTLFGTLFNLPSPATFIASTGAWSSALYDEFEPLIMMIIGVGLLVMLIGVVIKIFR